MSATSIISLYTKAYYDANKSAIDATAYVGNIGELVTIGNYTYISIKATYGMIPREVTRPLVDTQVQADLDDLRAGNIDQYHMLVEDFLVVREMQLTAGEWYDPYTFERWHDDNLNKERWRLILTRDGTQALSIQVMNPNGSYWYTPGAFIDQGDGTWLINSWDGGATVGDEDVYYQFIYGSLPISQILHAPAGVATYNSTIAYGGSTPNE